MYFFLDICLIEWPQRFGSLYPKECLEILIQRDGKIRNQNHINVSFGI